jgi:hypothetical protein
MPDVDGEGGETQEGFFSNLLTVPGILVPLQVLPDLWVIPNPFPSSQPPS